MNFPISIENKRNANQAGQNKPKGERKLCRRHMKSYTLGTFPALRTDEHKEQIKKIPHTLHTLEVFRVFRPPKGNEQDIESPQIVGVWKSNQNTAETKAKINRGRQTRKILPFQWRGGNRRRQKPPWKWGRKTKRPSKTTFSNIYRFEI